MEEEQEEDRRLKGGSDKGTREREREGKTR